MKGWPGPVPGRPFRLSSPGSRHPPLLPGARHPHTISAGWAWAAGAGECFRPVSGTLVFVTDYGLEDGDAAQLWAAAWSAAPGLRCVDGTRSGASGDVLTAAYRCKALARAFGPGSVICAVVDPGVGGHREAVAVECDGLAGVAPDTGLVSYLWMEARQRYAAKPRHCTARIDGNARPSGKCSTSTSPCGNQPASKRRLNGVRQVHGPGSFFTRPRGL